MKKVFFTFALVLMAAFALQTQAYAQGGAAISFEKKVHDFGNMKQHGDASTEFVFTNDGTAPLIVSNAKGSCGCTVPEWPREPIKPGESSVIKVKYDSKRVGPINKSVTITSNGSEQPIVLRIKGNIEAAPAQQTTPLKAPSAGAPVSN